MSAQEGADLLTEAGIRPTSNRILVTEALSAAGRPMSLTELETLLETIDKSGIFRTLVLLKEHHLVHSIEDGDTVRYELCHSHDHRRDDDLHPHFFCEKCHRTFCLDGIAIPPVPVPEGYRPESINYLIKGICPECR